VIAGRWTWLLLAALWAPAGVAAQQSLAAVAENARRALQRGNLAGLLRSSDRILLQLPNVQPSAAVGAAQAEATLRAVLGRNDDHEVSVAGHREIERGRGYVELQRLTRHRAGGALRVQTILLGYRRAVAGWVLVEVRVF